MQSTDIPFAARLTLARESVRNGRPEVRGLQVRRVVDGVEERGLMTYADPTTDFAEVVLFDGSIVISTVTAWDAK